MAIIIWMPSLYILFYLRGAQKPGRTIAPSELKPRAGRSRALARRPALKVEPRDPAALKIDMFFFVSVKLYLVEPRDPAALKVEPRDPAALKVEPRGPAALGARHLISKSA